MSQQREQPGGDHRIIDLFAGPGGLDVGATWLGIPVIGIELDGNACETRMAAGLETEKGSVRDYGPAKFPDATVLTAGPPCQTFTVAGKGAGRRALDEVVRRIKEMSPESSQPLDERWSEDERTELVLEPMRWVLSALKADRPYEAIVLEQVPAVMPIWTAYGEVLAGYGYKCDIGILRAEEFGVPQTRRRAILIARRGAAAVGLPSPTHEAFRKGAASQASLQLQPCVSMGQALGGRPTPFSVISNYGSGGDPRNRGRRHSGEPAATVTGKITRNRLQLPGGASDRLSLQEAGLLQTFPRDYPWSGSDIGQQIGNAIPPRLAVHILAQALDLCFSPQELDRVVGSEWEHSRERPMRTGSVDLEDARGR